MTAGSEGSWLGRWRDVEAGKYEYRTLGDLSRVPARDRYAEAVLQLEEWFRHLEQGGSSGDDTVAAVCAAKVEQLRKDKGESSAEDARQKLARFVDDDPIARIDLAKLKRAHVQAWRERLEAGGGAPNSINRYLIVFRSALNLARRRGLVASDMAWREPLKALSVDQSQYRRELYLDRAQRQSLIEHAAGDFKPLALSWSLLPVRPGEIVACRVSDLNLRQRTLKIPKNKTKAREIPLTDEALAHFQQCAKGKTPAAWLVSRSDGSQWIRRLWRKPMKAALRAAGLPLVTVPYTLRHSVITDLVTGGVDLMTVARLSGTSLAMIDAHYGKLVAEHARKALSILSLK